MINLKNLLNETFLGGGKLPSSKLIKMKQTLSEIMEDEDLSVNEGPGDMDRMQEINADFSTFIKKNLSKIKRLPKDKQIAFGKLLGNFKDGLDDLSENKSESVNEAGVPKMYVKYRAVIKKIKELEDKQKELAKPYFDARSKGDTSVAKSQLQLMKKNQKELSGYRKNLASIESKYIDNMDYFPGE